VSESTLLALLGFVIDTTVKGSVVILLVALLQRLVGRQLGARWRHALWLVVLLRLAVPAGPASRWSVFNLLPLREAAAPITEVRAVSAAQGSSAVLRTKELVNLLREHSWWAPSWRWMLGIWLFGALAVALRALVGAIRTQIALRHAAAGEVNSEVIEAVKTRLGIRRRFLVIESELVDAPALHGLLRPVLLLPKGFSHAFDREELRHVVLHELWHLRRFDVAVNWVLSVVLALHWFNPLVWFAVSRIREERELACDELALSCLEEDERLGYGRTILKLLERFRVAAPVPALVGIVNHKRKMKRRLLMITNYRNRMRFSIVFAAALAVVGVVGLTDARGGEPRMMRQLDPAAMATAEKMRQHVSLDLTDASLSELLTAVANKTGVAVLQSPGTAASNVQQARFTLHADNVPAMDLLVMALGPFRVMPMPDANGVTVYKMIVPAGEGAGIEKKKLLMEQKRAAEEAEGGVMIRRSAPNGDEPAAEDGRTKVFVRSADGTEGVNADGTPRGDVVYRLEDKRAAEGVESGMTIVRRQAPNGDGPGAKEGLTKISIHSASGSDNVEGVVNPDGTVHRDLTFNMEEKGVVSQGRLVLDIKGVK
jgi:beta-lactamase regulating signal transducer with metallopeptidase domain